MQHVELNRAGWWERTVQRLIITSVWLHGGTLARDTITADLRQRCGINVDQRVVAQVDALLKAGTLLQFPFNQVKLAEQSRHELELDVHQAEAVQQAAKDHFVQLLGEHAPSLDPDRTWRVFLTTFFEPAVKEYGAQLYHLLSANEPVLPTAYIEQFLPAFPEPTRDGLRRTMAGFLHPGHASTRAFVLCSLNAYFCLEAINLSPTVIANIAKSTKKNPTFELFLDTNFLLYLVGLRDDEYHAALTLVDLIHQLQGRAHIRLQVLPITIDETKRVISAAQASLSGLQVTKHLAEAALRAGLDDIAKKFIKEAAQQPLAAETYFGPYLRDLLEVIRSHGAEFHNTRLEPYKTDQRVIDDILAQQQFEQTHYAEKAKGYEQLEHDITLWHFIQRRRPAMIESPLEAHSWVITLDRRLLAFDANKRKRTGQRIPVCLHPATLMHLLQFFVPRTAAFEDAILGSMGLPFFHEFTSNDERVTIRILHTLGRFQDANNISQNTATNILFNDALRQKLTPDLAPEQEFALIKEALVQELQEKNQQLETVQATAASLEQTRTEQEETIASKDRNLATLQATAAAQTAEIARLTQALRVGEQAQATERIEREQHTKELEGRLARLETQHHETDTRQQRHAIARKQCLAAGITSLSCFAVVRGAGWSLPQLQNTAFAIVAGILALLTWSFFAQRAGARHPLVASWPAFQRFQRWNKALIGFGGLIVIRVAGNAVYNLLKQLWKDLP